jgi:hypothetical protein
MIEKYTNCTPNRVHTNAAADEVRTGKIHHFQRERKVKTLTAKESSES